MAEDKKSFLMYADTIHLVKKLVKNDRINKTNDAGELFLQILGYVNDEKPEPINLIVDISFEPIKQQLKRDLVKWEGELDKKSESGSIGNLKRWNLDLYKRYLSKEITLEEALEIAKNRKASHPDSLRSQGVAKIAVSDSVSVSDSVTDILLKKETKEIFSFKNSLIEFGFEKNLVEDWLKVRKTKKATNTETAFKKFIEQVLKTNAPCNEILELCIFRSWSGYNSDWYEKEKGAAEKEKPFVGRMTEKAIKNSIDAFR